MSFLTSWFVTAAKPVIALLIVSLVTVSCTGFWAGGEGSAAGSSDDEGRQPSPTLIDTTPTATSTVARPTATQQAATQVIECTTDQVVAIVDGFVEAINEGDQAAIAEYLPKQNYEYAPSTPQVDMDPEEFRGFGLNEFQFGDAQEVAEHFSQRHTNDSLQVEVMEVIANVDLRGYADEIAAFAAPLRLKSDSGIREVNGKGSVNCVAGTILMWYMGDIPSE